jgi:hypothetical protein
MMTNTKCCTECSAPAEARWCAACLRVRFARLAAEPATMRAGCLKCRTARDHGKSPGRCIAGRYGHTGAR